MKTSQLFEKFRRQEIKKPYKNNIRKGDMWVYERYIHMSLESNDHALWFIVEVREDQSESIEYDKNKHKYVKFFDCIVIRKREVFKIGSLWNTKLSLNEKAQIRMGIGICENEVIGSCADYLIDLLFWEYIMKKNPEIIKKYFPNSYAKALLSVKETDK